MPRCSATKPGIGRHTQCHSRRMCVRYQTSKEITEPVRRKRVPRIDVSSDRRGSLFTFVQRQRRYCEEIAAGRHKIVSAGWAQYHGAPAGSDIHIHKLWSGNEIKKHATPSTDFGAHAPRLSIAKRPHLSGPEMFLPSGMARHSPHLDSGRCRNEVREPRSPPINRASESRLLVQTIDNPQMACSSAHG